MNHLKLPNSPHVFIAFVLLYLLYSHFMRFSRFCYTPSTGIGFVGCRQPMLKRIICFHQWNCWKKYNVDMNKLCLVRTYDAHFSDGRLQYARENPKSFETPSSATRINEINKQMQISYIRYICCTNIYSVPDYCCWAFVTCGIQAQMDRIISDFHLKIQFICSTQIRLFVMLVFCLVNMFDLAFFLVLETTCRSLYTTEWQSWQKKKFVEKLEIW